MLRAILFIGLLTVSASAAVIAFAPYDPKTDLEQAGGEADAPVYLLGARELIPELRPAVPLEPTAPAKPPPGLLAPLPASTGANSALPPGSVPPDLVRPAQVRPAQVRDVTPPGMTAGPTVTGPLIRVVPPPPLETVQAGLPARQERLFNPLIISAGVIKVREREVRLGGIEAPHFEERCGGEGVAAWPCGRMARAALRRFVRGRAIECAVPEGAAAIPDPADCKVAGASLAEWLVAQGWAKPAEGSYAEQESAARQRKLGLWAEARPDSPLPGRRTGQAEELAARDLPIDPDSAAPMRARLSGTP